jgi:hypothetical protein
LKNFVPTCGQIAKQAFFPEDTFVHAKGLRIAVGICRTALVKPWTEKLRAVSREVRCQEFIFFPYQIEGGKIWHVTIASIQEIFFYLDMRGVNLLDVGRRAPRN